MKRCSRRRRSGKSAMGRSRRGWSRANPRTTPGSVGGRGGRDGREAERPSFPGSRTTRKYCRRTRKGRSHPRKPAESLGRDGLTSSPPPMADGRGGMTSGHRGRQPVPEATNARVYRVRSGVHARRRAANIARVADALLFVLARVFAKRRSRTALSSTRPRFDLKSEASGAKLSFSANEKQFSEKISQSISRAPFYGRSYVHINRRRGSLTPRAVLCVEGRARACPFGYSHLLARGPRNKRHSTPSVDTTPPPLTLRPTVSLHSALYQLPPFSRSMAKNDSGACALSSAPASVPMV